MPNPFFPNAQNRQAEAEERVAALEAILDDREGKLREATALYEHAKRELPQVKARIERSSQEELRGWKEQFLVGFVELLDDVDRALEVARAPGTSPAVREGLELVAARFSAKLAEEGVERVRANGPFDPHLHEAVSTEPVASPHDVGAITAVVAHGYRIGDRLLRPARVIVGAREA